MELPARVAAMLRPFSDLRYDHYLTLVDDVTPPPGVDAAALAPFCAWAATALPELVEPDDQPTVSPTAGGYDEPLVTVGHRRVRTPAPYWHEGWEHARALTWLRASVAAALGRVADALPERFGLVVLDGWRPLELQREIYDAAYADPSLPPGFVAPPSGDPATPPAHVSGGAVDVTLSCDGVGLGLGTHFDEFDDAAHTAAFEVHDGLVRALRRILVRAMAAEGFVVLDCEWWHFELGTRRWAALRDTTPWYGPAVEPTLLTSRPVPVRA